VSLKVLQRTATGTCTSNDVCRKEFTGWLLHVLLLPQNLGTCVCTVVLGNKFEEIRAREIQTKHSTAYSVVHSYIISTILSLLLVVSISPSY
jgi:hypothetical protein